MSKKVSSNEHHSTVRERVMAPNTGQLTGRAKRRAEQRKLAKAERKARIAAKLAENPRLVRA